jgi:hypothetical protein
MSIHVAAQRQRVSAGECGRHPMVMECAWNRELKGCLCINRGCLWKAQEIPFNEDSQPGRDFLVSMPPPRLKATDWVGIAPRKGASLVVLYPGIVWVGG